MEVEILLEDTKEDNDEIYIVGRAVVNVEPICEPSLSLQAFGSQVEEKMKHTKYPVLVQQMIFEEMTNVILLLLSLGSFNVKKMIKLTQKKRLNKPGGMVFCTGSPNEEIYISNIIYNQGKPVREIQEPILGIVRGLNVKKDWFQDFFEGEREYLWRTHANKIVFPEVEGLSICISASSPKNISIKHFEGYDLMMGPLKNSDFYKTECLRVKGLGSVVLDILRYNEGRQVEISCCGPYKYLRLGNFINRWKTGAAHHKLEYLSIDIYNLMDWSPIPKADILEYTGCGKLDESKFGPLHTAPLVCGSHYRTQTTPSFWSHDYVVRETDNRVASVKIEDFRFIFGVWEMTEREFLEMSAKEEPNLLENLNLLFD
ncbi:hypothetical protein B9Z55_027112 [Caenorhabditis nigoni]|nr:hypothetical protein B9Z55_027112 [Caenorhabditis nigoni]